MAAAHITPRKQNFPQWYQDVISCCPDLFDESPVTGCITFGPLATKLWENVKKWFDEQIKALGVENIMLPTLIPESYFRREKEHVEGFAPEVAVVTHAGGNKLSEPLFVRPTSELLFVDWFGRSGRVQSHRDLPLLANQWCSVLRWEKRPRAFLRTTEFHWQEGHCLFATENQCREFTLKILDLYAELAEKLLAIPVIKGEKPSHERFPGALNTYTIEGMMQDGKALQMGTTHVLSQDFLKGSDGKPMVQFLDEDEKLSVPFYDSWGLSTRVLGAIFMAHGDDDGIVLPPAIAPVACAVLPIFGADEKGNDIIREAARKLALDLTSFKLQASSCKLTQVQGRENWFEEISAPGELTVRIDQRDCRLGEKTFHQIRSGTPVRIELGAKELADKSCVIKSRIRPREAAVKVPLAKAAETVAQILREDQETLHVNAQKRFLAQTIEPKNYAELKEALSAGKWALAAWDGTKETVDKLKAETSGGSYRCFGFANKDDAKGAKDPVSGKPSGFGKRIYVAKAY
jgi:prolyl-tRNA synthetase